MHFYHRTKFVLTEHARTRAQERIPMLKNVDSINLDYIITKAVEDAYEINYISAPELDYCILSEEFWNKDEPVYALVKVEAKKYIILTFVYKKSLPR
ncbi:hypothetical protein MCAV_00260 [[Mycoplasma] cavipharyngis]|uniref:hypothetical protein n=1 Tax=[Mycoplasma] cavipharyngis TaxID=92757 RepID=UPI003703CBDC